MSEIVFVETPHNTVHATATGDATQYDSLIRSIAAHAGHRKLGGRITSGASFLPGGRVEVRVVYSTKR